LKSNKRKIRRKETKNTDPSDVHAEKRRRAASLLKRTTGTKTSTSLSEDRSSNSTTTTTTTTLRRPQRRRGGLITTNTPQYDEKTPSPEELLNMLYEDILYHFKCPLETKRELKSIPLTFPNSEAYISTFGPILLSEIEAELKSNIDRSFNMENKVVPQILDLVCQLTLPLFTRTHKTNQTNKTNKQTNTHNVTGTLS